jgi:hypothetical protein
MLTSKKTTVLGILSILGALVGAATAFFSGHPVDFASLAAAVMAGVGLIAAKDHNVTGGTITVPPAA